MAGQSKRGFTLIELLVVIAIIALLLSIIMPALKKAKSHARAVIDLNNLKSLSTAMHIYLNLSNDRFFDYPGAGTTNHLWLERIGILVDNIDDVRHCPETIARNQEVAASFTGGSIWGESLSPWLWGASTTPGQLFELGSYGLNGWLYGECPYVANAHKSLSYGNRASVKSPSLTPLLLDSNWVDGWPRNDNVLPATYNYDQGDRGGGDSMVSTMIGRFIIGRHGPKTNVIFMDGQVKTIPHADLWSLAWHKGSQPNYNPAVPKPYPANR